MSSRMIQNNFSGGEISPSLFGRSDLQAYYKGCETAENFIVSKEGTLRKRRGIQSLFTMPKGYDRCKIIPYKFDRTEGGFFLLYIKEDDWDDGSTDSTATLIVKFYDKDGTLHEWEDVLEGQNEGEEQNITISQLEISGFKGSIKNFQNKQIGDEVWITNGETYRILRVINNEKFSIVEWSQVGQPETLPYENDKFGYLPYEIQESTHWSIEPSTYSQGQDIRMKDYEYGVFTVRDSVRSEMTKSSVRFPAIWQAGTYINVGAFIPSVGFDYEKWDYIVVAKRTGSSYGEVGRFYLSDTADEFYGKPIDASETDPLIRIYKHSDGKYYNYEEGTTYFDPKECNLMYYRYVFRDENHSPTDLIYDQTNVLGGNFTTPMCVDCFQQRRVFANATNDSGKLPMTLWFSEVGNLDNFYAGRPAADDDPFSPSIASNGPAFIRFIVTYQETMIIFTESGLFSVGFSQQTGFSAKSCRISKFSDLSCSPNIQPVVTDAGVVFVGADKKTVYSISYSLQEQSFKPINRSVLVEHLTRTSSIKAIALQEYPDNVVWVVTEDGKACTFTIEKNEEVYSWSHSRISGNDFLDVISIGTCSDSSSDRTYGDLVFVVGPERVSYACRMKKMYFGDLGYTDTIGGVETPITAFVKTLRAESQERTIVGMKKNVKDAIIRLYETGKIYVRSPDGGSRIPLVEGKKDVGLFTGDIKVMPRGFVNQDGRLELVSDDAFPCEILQIVLDMEIS